MNKPGNEADHKKKYRQFSRLYVGALLGFLLVIVLFSVTVVRWHGQAKPQAGAKAATIAKDFSEKQGESQVAESASPPPSRSTSPTPPSTSPNANAPSASRPYVASVCTKTTLPYTTKNVEKLLSPGDAVTSGGVDGYIQKCTADSNGNKPADVTVPAIDKIVYLSPRPQ
jgi:cytoskeletal protein RodZ